MKKILLLIFVLFIVTIVSGLGYKYINRPTHNYINYNNKIYRCFYNGPLNDEDVGNYLGMIEKRVGDKYNAPKGHLESNFLEKGTEIYEWTSETYESKREYPFAIIYYNEQTEDGLEVCRINYN